MPANLSPRTNLLLTGASGVGKSTLLKSAGQRLKGQRLKGFFSEVIGEDDKRKGWRLDTFEGDGGVLIHLDMPSEHRMGRYGADMALFNRLVAAQLTLSDDVDLYLVDETGIVAGWSPGFQVVMTRLLDSSKKVIAIVRQRGDGPMKEAKARPDAELWEATLQNCAALLEQTLA